MEPQGLISFNLDDGWKSGFETALPIFDSEGIDTTYYVTTGQLGFDDFISSDDVASVASRGHEIGNHTMTHADLTQVSPGEVEQEILGAQLDLENLGVQAATFAYPYGASNGNVRSLVSQHFAGARGTDNGYIDHESDRYNLPSWDIGGMDFAEIQAIIDGAVAEKKWVVFIIHKLDVAGDPESISSEVLQEAIDYAQEQQMKFVTNSEGLAAMETIE